ncbi:endothelin-converting enzyme homolog [Drosophila pseudoobscura]|uniref:Endothelin-converting enzyme homolog n=1 Tax=Drosophila pseudoobscura pseudoobscura TaxID=46245 RepID=A0A6I8UN27_DROPS|nr:endothelin-converting enzyme homolog [Drosophila pseudoobscura]
MKASRAARWNVLILLLLLAHVDGVQRHNGMNRMPLQQQQQGPMYGGGQLQQIPPHPDSREEFKVRQLMGLEMQKYMNLSADPCVDFFEFACGHWGGYHKRQQRQGAAGAGAPLVTAQQVVEAKIVDQLQQLLTAPLPPQHHPNQYSGATAANVRKVRSFYDSCVAVEANAGERRRFLMKILKDNGGLRNVANSNWQHNRHWLQTLAELRRNYGLDILLGLEIDLNLQQLGGNSIYLGEPRLTIIPEEHCNVVATRGAHVRDLVYEQIQQQVADNLRDWLALETGEAARIAGDIIRFEFELCKHMRGQQLQQQPAAQEEDLPPVALPFGARSRIGQDRLHRQKASGITLTDLTTEMGGFFDFKLYVEVILESLYTSVVYLRSPDYIKHLVRTARANNRYTIAAYIMYVALNELNQPPEEHPSRRARQCVQVMQRLFPQVLGEMYQRQVQRDDAKDDLQQVFSDLVKAFEQQLRVDWLDDNDRRAARARLAQYHTLLPDYQNLDLAELQFQKSDDYWHKLELALRFRARQQLNGLRGNDFGQEPEGGLVDGFEVRAALVARQQAVLVGWGLLQAPYYNYHYPRALKYAQLGQRLASALVQAFDDEGWNRHPQATSPWNELTMSGYRNVTECQRAQYSNYLYNQPAEFRNATRLREIMADSSGLNVAFNAYLAWLEQQDNKPRPLLYKETLPELNFTNTQLFFLYFAQTRCWARSNQEAVPFLESMPLMQHTAERWDVNGPLSNSVEFGREFGCALGTQMNSGDKCLVY